LGYQNRLTGNAPQAQAIAVTKSSVAMLDDTQGIHTKSTRAIGSKQTLSKAAILCIQYLMMDEDCSVRIGRRITVCQQLDPLLGISELTEHR
jgi:hypothetical protein